MSGQGTPFHDGCGCSSTIAAIAVFVVLLTVLTVLMVLAPGKAT